MSSFWILLLLNTKAKFYNYKAFTLHNRLNPLTTSMSLLYRNQSIDMFCKSPDWFLYERHWLLEG